MAGGKTPKWIIKTKGEVVFTNTRSKTKEDDEEERDVQPPASFTHQPYITRCVL